MHQRRGNAVSRRPVRNGHGAVVQLIMHSVSEWTVQRIDRVDCIDPVHDDSGGVLRCGGLNGSYAMWWPCAGVCGFGAVIGGGCVHRVLHERWHSSHGEFT